MDRTSSCEKVGKKPEVLSQLAIRCRGGLRMKEVVEYQRRLCYSKEDVMCRRN
jgi:hypothetical protein